MVWAVKRGVLSYAATQFDSALVAFAGWVGSLSVRVGGEREDVLRISKDEHLLNWVVDSVQSGGTPRETLLWVSPHLGVYCLSLFHAPLFRFVPPLWLRLVIYLGSDLGYIFAFAL